MKLSNSQQEESWGNSWNDLYDLIKKIPGGFILIDNYIETNLEDAQAIIQNRAYKSQLVEFEVVFYKGKKSILIKNKY